VTADRFIPLTPAEIEALAPEADRTLDAPHPRETLILIGQGQAEAAFAAAIASGRLHHAWLIGGPQGIGKATLAYRVARRLLAERPGETGPSLFGEEVAPAGLAVAPDDPATGKIARLAHPDLAVIRRGPRKDGKALREEIAVEDVRNATRLFQFTAGASGARVIIVDAADDLNRNAANALLKMMEEPPPGAIFLIVAHQPGRLLPTIRSRCRMLRLEPLASADLMAIMAGLGRPIDAATAAMAEGSVTQALRLIDPDSAAFRDKVMAVLDRLPALDTGAVAALAETVQGRDGGERFQILHDLLGAHLAGAIRSGSTARRAAAAEQWDALTRQAREVDVFNLDRRPFVLQALADLAALARQDRGG
jgi:DNA polymerase-3 subunit delta'